MGNTDPLSIYFNFLTRVGGRTICMWYSTNLDAHLTGANVFGSRTCLHGWFMVNKVVRSTCFGGFANDGTLLLLAVTDVVSPSAAARYLRR